MLKMVVVVVLVVLGMVQGSLGLVVERASVVL